MTKSLINLRAELAMRDEDLRIATKHCREAAAREATPENIRAYEDACRWMCNRARAHRAAFKAFTYARRNEVRVG